jgi:hypothetical protein
MLTCPPSAALPVRIDAPVENNSSADAGAERCVKDVAKSHACAPDRFRQRRGVRVIVNLRANLKKALHFRGERKIPPAWQIGRIQHNAANRIERTWRANSDSS